MSSLLQVRPTFSFTTPLSLSNCTLWLDGSDVTTLQFATGTSNVTAWIDKSPTGNNFIRPGPTNSPVYSRDSVYNIVGLSFDGNNSALSPSNASIFSITSANTSNSWTFFTVHRVNSNAIGNVWREINGGAPWLRWRNVVGGNFNTGSADIGWGLGNVSAMNPISCLLMNTTAVGQGFINGASVGTAVKTTVSSNIAFTLGSVAGTGSERMNGFIFEVIVYNRALNVTERTQVTNWLAWKWNLQRFLSGSLATVVNPNPRTLTQIVPLISTYSPLNSGTAILWLDASDRTTLTVNASSLVTAWTDKSGFGGSISVASGASFFSTYSGNGLNGNPCVITASGTSGGRIFGNYGAGQTSLAAYSLFMAIQAVSVSGVNARIFGTNRSGGNDFLSGQGFNIQAGSLPGNIVTEGITAVLRNPTAVPFEPFILTFTGNLPSAITLASFAIGQPSFQDPSTGNNWGIRIGEVLLYRTVLSTAEVYRVQSYLAQKWAIRGYLSVGNPFQNQPIAGFTRLIIRNGAPLPVGSRVQFTYTGALQTYSVPSSANLILVQMWGAGGGPAASVAGAGAYVEGFLRVTGGETIEVIVGRGGTNWGPGGTEVQGWGGASGRLAGDGGGFSAVRRSASAYLAIAGAGGGAGRNITGRDGGAGTATGDGYQGGTGGIKSTAANGVNGGGGSATSALGRQGQAGQAQGSGGGGGGFGGGRGGTADPSGGGGGSSFTSLLLSPVLFDGVGGTPGNSTSPLRGTAGNPATNGTVYITPYTG